MKLIYAIVRYDNEDEVINALTKKHYSVTKLATTGGFRNVFRRRLIPLSRSVENARRLQSICHISLVLL